MEIPGRVQNGVVILQGATLPEGSEVAVRLLPPQSSQASKKRIEVPLVRTGEPGSVDLTGEKITQILDEEDASSGH